MTFHNWTCPKCGHVSSLDHLKRCSQCGGSNMITFSSFEDYILNKLGREPGTTVKDEYCKFGAVFATNCKLKGSLKDGCLGCPNYEAYGPVLGKGEV